MWGQAVLLNIWDDRTTVPPLLTEKKFFFNVAIYTGITTIENTFYSCKASKLFFPEVTFL